MDIIPRPCRNSTVPGAGWVRCWSAKILGWAVSDPFKSDLDVCAMQGIVLGAQFPRSWFNPCVCNVGFQQREIASSQNQCRV